MRTNDPSRSDVVVNEGKHQGEEARDKQPELDTRSTPKFAI